MRYLMKNIIFFTFLILFISSKINGQNLQQNPDCKILFKVKWGSENSELGIQEAAMRGLNDTKFFFCPPGFRIDEAGKVYILDQVNGRIKIFNKNGKLVKNFPIIVIDTNFDLYFTIDSDKNIWIHDGRKGFFYVYNNDGKLIKRIIYDPAEYRKYIPVNFDIREGKIIGGNYEVNELTEVSSKGETDEKIFTTAPKILSYYYERTSDNSGKYSKNIYIPFCNLGDNEYNGIVGLRIIDKNSAQKDYKLKEFSTNNYSFCCEDIGKNIYMQVWEDVHKTFRIYKYSESMKYLGKTMLLKSNHEKGFMFYNEFVITKKGEIYFMAFGVDGPEISRCYIK